MRGACVRRVAAEQSLAVERGAAVVVPVLLYHSVSDVPAAGQEGFTVTGAQFDEHVAALVASGRTALTISQFAAVLRGERALPDRAVAVTFDDGFTDTLGAVERLRSAGISSTVYVTSSRVEREDGIAIVDLRAIAAGGGEIGAHSVSHPYLDVVADDAAVNEIVESKRSLEDRLGIDVATFAYPHGAHTQRVRAAVVDAGYSSAAAVKNALSHSHDDPFAIARVTITATTPMHTLLAVLEGHGKPVAWPGERYRTRAFREVRRLRHRARGRQTSMHSR
jgi:peptidoglycan/xylan/chitin deacetylase (PgdA/CDA1 family)